MQSPNLHDVELFHAMQTISTTAHATISQAAQLIVQAVTKIYPTQDSFPHSLADKLVQFYMYPISRTSFTARDVQVSYYLQAGVGINRIQKLTSCGQAYVYRIKEEGHAPIIAPSVPELHLPALRALVLQFNVMNGQALPEEAYRQEETQ